VICINHEYYGEIIPKRKNTKTRLAKIIFGFLGKGFVGAARFDSKVKEEILEWQELTTVVLKVEPFGPCMIIQKKEAELYYIGTEEPDKAHLVIAFKNIEAAILVLTGKIGISQAYAEHRMTIKGDIALAMSVVRCMYIVEVYLFPNFINRKILKKIPKKGTSTFKIYKSAVFGVSHMKKINKSDCEGFFLIF
jgi:hypothetical protein